MPLIRLPNRKLLYYAHVPKCAGTSVENYLVARFGRLGLLDRSFSGRSPSEAWSLSPPQHMPEPVRRALLPDTLFDALFATVRHPLRRLQSVFLFQREVERALPARMTFERWLDGIERTLALDPYALHGHLRPMAETVPPKARVFRIEDGMALLVDWLDEMAGTEDGPREIGRDNVLSARAPGVCLPDPPPRVCARVAELYARDYDRFDYPAIPVDDPARAGGPPGARDAGVSESG